jgi:hypothetical protein
MAWHKQIPKGGGKRVKMQRTKLQDSKVHCYFGNYDFLEIINPFGKVLGTKSSSNI